MRPQTILQQTEQREIKAPSSSRKILALIRAATPTQPPLIKQWLIVRHKHSLAASALHELGSSRNMTDPGQRTLHPWKLLPPVL